MKLQIVAYGVLREVFGARCLAVVLPPNTTTVADALDALAVDHPSFAPFRGSTAVAIDATLVRAETVLEPGVTLDLLPPVSGG